MMQQIPDAAGVRKSSLRPVEQLVFALREIYDGFGYSRYRMSKFEEYDLYANHKDFLIAEGVITFTDTNGKLMALKPDVTLSIVKNTQDPASGVQKLYYNENVYRIRQDAAGYQEILQTGLEAIGAIDDYTLCEVMELALLSLQKAGGRYVLEISNLGLLSELIDACGVSAVYKAQVLALIGEKNRHELQRLLEQAGVEAADREKILALLRLDEDPAAALSQAEQILKGKVDDAKLQQFVRVVKALLAICGGQADPTADGQTAAQPEGAVRLDFSLVGDPNYYDGVIFKGYLEGVPKSVLSGGEYNALMRKMGRKSGAIGFAVYMDLLERYLDAPEGYDTDILLLYSADVPLEAVRARAEELGRDGSRVMAQAEIPEGVRYRKLVRFDGSGDACGKEGPDGEQ